MAENTNSQQSTSTICTIVALLCGLPGSGKSTLAEQLTSSCCQCKQDDRITDVVHIEYDEVEADLWSTLSDQKSKDDTRKAASPSVDEESTCTREIWKRSRTKSLDVLRTTLKEQQEKISASENRSSTKLILMDDNFHLRSMRREVYRICQDSVVSADSRHKIYFVILWLDIPRKVCLERNQRRDRSVPDDVVRRMSETLEPPGKESFEHCFKRIVDFGPMGGNDTSDMTDITKSPIFDFVTKECMEHYMPVPPPPPPIDLEQLEEERRKTRESWLHIWDQRLRSWVGQVAQISRKDTGNANKARKKLLQTLRQEVQQAGDPTELPDMSQISDRFLTTMGAQWSDEQREKFHKAIQVGSKE